MPEIDLSSLSAAELRDLLDSTRQRGQAAQSYQILQEMAERRTRSARPPSAHPREIALELGDPLEDLEAGVPHPAAVAAAATPAGAPPARADDPLDVDLALAFDERPARRRKLARSSRRADDPPPPRRRFPVLGFSVGVALGLVMGLGLGIQSRPPPSEPATAVFPQAPALRPSTAAAEPAPPVAQAPAETAPADIAPIPGPAASGPATPAPTTPSPTTLGPMTPAPATEAAPSPAKGEAVAGPAAPAAPEDVKPVPAATDAAEPAKACANAPTPADRTICGDARLLKLQKQLRQAYARALEAHTDRATLRQRQLAWRDMRSGVADPERLAELYAARIKRLDAATEAARNAQSPAPR